MRINLDYGFLESQLSILQNQIADYNSYFDSIYEMMNRLGSWIGKDSAEYTAQVKILKENIMKMKNNVDALAEDLKTGIQKYKDAASKVSSYALKI